MNNKFIKIGYTEKELKYFEEIGIIPKEKFYYIEKKVKKQIEKEGLK